MTQSVAVTINGRRREDQVEPRLLLVHYLREVAGLTGTHIACDTSQCGSCTVLLDGEAVKSCSLFAVQADGRSVTTIEGLAANGTLHPVQQAFWSEHGLQCGFCTPGFIMAAAYLLEQNPIADRRGDRQGSRGQPLPLHRLHEHQARRADGGRGDERLDDGHRPLRAGHRERGGLAPWR